MWYWLLLLGLAQSPPAFPPDGCILLQPAEQVTLRWNLPGRRFRVRVLQGEKIVQDLVTNRRNCPVGVENDGPYQWSVQALDSSASESHSFRVSCKNSYVRDGLNGSRGCDGSPGPNLDVELSRDHAGMNLFIQDGPKRLHYIFCERAQFFLISARGGNGGKGHDGPKVRRHGSAGHGGIGGAGGIVRITTFDAPWRDYLRVDVRGGAGGEAGTTVDQRDQYGELIQGWGGFRGWSGRDGSVKTKIGR